MSAEPGRVDTPEGRKGGRPSKAMNLDQAKTVLERAEGDPRHACVVLSRAAGLGENWTPRELRHSFVSIMSDNGVTLEQIADLVGHRTTIVTQKVYRHQLKPVISTGATAMNTIFGNKKTA